MLPDIIIGGSIFHPNHILVQECVVLIIPPERMEQQVLFLMPEPIFLHLPVPGFFHPAVSYRFEHIEQQCAFRGQGIVNAGQQRHPRIPGQHAKITVYQGNQVITAPKAGRRIVLPAILDCQTLLSGRLTGEPDGAPRYVHAGHLIPLMAEQFLSLIHI